MGKFVHLHASIQFYYPLLSLHVEIILGWACLGAANGDGGVNLSAGGIPGVLRACSWLVGSSWRPWGGTLWCLASAFFDFAGLCFVRVAACYVLGEAAMAHGINISSFLKS